MNCSRTLPLALRAALFTCLAATLHACGGGSDTGSGNTDVPTVSNRAPTAVAGSNQSVVAGSTVTLDGSGSFDPDGNALSYAWTLSTRPALSSAVLVPPASTSPRPSLQLDAPGTYVATLVVSDGTLSSTASQVTLVASVLNAAPVANAGSAQSVLTGSQVSLDGRGSTDANGDALTWQWSLPTRPAGSTATLSGAQIAQPSFIADRAGTYVARLVVNDGKSDSAPAEVTLTASTANAAPVARAGSDQSVLTGASVTLDGSGSTDANGDTLSYRWTLTSRPSGSTAVLSSASAVSPSLVADLAGLYVASLVVNDGQLDSAVSTVTITVTAPTLSLYSIQTSFVGGTQESLQAWPFATSSSAQSNSTCSGSGCPTRHTVAQFKLAASAGRSYTVTNLSAVNLTTGSAVVASFTGLSNGQVIAAGQSASFDLVSDFTRGATVQLRYQFTVLETGDTFQYDVNLKTN